MKRILTVFVLLALSVSAQASGTVTVTGNRVSLRASPEPIGVLLGRAMKGDELQLKDNSQPGWVGVVPPDAVDLWVHSEFIVDGVVTTEKLNVRSGPSLNHSVVGILTDGQTVDVRGKIADWVRIAPPSDCTAWISRQFTDIALPERSGVPVMDEVAEVPEMTKTVIMPKPVELPEAVVSIDPPEQPETVVVEPTLEQVMVAASETVQKRLIPDPSKEQGLPETFSGLLKRADEPLYKLVNPKAVYETVCYVRGNSEQMQTYAKLPLRLTGKIYWAEGLDFPIIVPAKIEVLNK